MAIRKHFFLVVVDHDKKEYALHGPMADDTAHTERVVARQARGHNVYCFTQRDRSEPVDLVAQGYRDALS